MTLGFFRTNDNTKTFLLPAARGALLSLTLLELEMENRIFGIREWAVYCLLSGHVLGILIFSLWRNCGFQAMRGCYIEHLNQSPVYGGKAGAVRGDEGWDFSALDCLSVLNGSAASRSRGPTRRRNSPVPGKPLVGRQLTSGWHCATQTLMPPSMIFSESRQWPNLQWPNLACWLLARQIEMNDVDLVEHYPCFRHFVSMAPCMDAIRVAWISYYP